MQCLEKQVHVGERCCVCVVFVCKDVRFQSHMGSHDSHVLGSRDSHVLGFT